MSQTIDLLHRFLDNFPVRMPRPSPWNELAPDILILIYEKLSYKDSLRFTCVCKNWHNTINRRVPWMLLYSSDKEKPWSLVRHGSTISFSDDYSRIVRTVDILPSLTGIYGILQKEDFAGINVLATKHGWVLLTDCRRSEFCCFNVFTCEAMRLPSLQNLNEDVPMKGAFSDVPTRQDSVIFLIFQNGENSVEILTYHPGEKTWRSNVFLLPGNRSSFQDVAYSKGKFYCISREGLGIYDLKNQEFHYLEPEIPRLKTPFSTLHLSESDGEILLIPAEENIPYSPVWKLNLQNMRFLPVEKLGDRALFVSFGSNSICARCETESFMNKVFYPGSLISCWSMSVRTGSHEISESYPWISKDRTDSKLIWIEPS